MPASSWRLPRTDECGATMQEYERYCSKYCDTAGIKMSNNKKTPAPSQPSPASNSVFKGPHFDRIFLAMVVAIAVYLSLVGLDNHAFWDDEAQVAIFAKTFIKTGTLSGWDGRNLFTFRRGDLLDAELRSINSPADYIAAAIGIKLCGFSSWSARLPFVLVGLPVLLVLWFLIREELPQRPEIARYAVTLTALSYSFLLNIRQCRYYALSMFFGLASYYLYKRALREKRIICFALMGLSLVFTFYANYLLCAALMVGLAIEHALFHLKGCTKREWLFLAIAGCLFIAFTLPYAIDHQIWVRRHTGPAQAPSLIQKLLVLSYWNLRELDLAGYLPGWLVVATIGLCVAFRKKIVLPPALYQWAVTIGGYILALSALSVQRPVWQGWNAGLADIRYLSVLIPFCAAVIAVFLAALHRLPFGRLIAPVAAAVVVLTNAFSFNIASPGFRWLLPAYINEIHNNYETSYDAAVRYLDANAKPDDVVYCVPEYAINVIHSYLGDKLRMQGLLRPGTPLSGQALANIDGPKFITDRYPNWFISFGLQNETAQMLQQFSQGPYSYGCDEAFSSCSYAARLDVFYLDMTRPELPWHNFGPVTRFDPNTSAVYVFRRQSKLPTGESR
jgi:hypothetical protein